MDVKEALKVVESLSKEIVILNKKKLKFFKYAKISLIATIIFLITFIAVLVVSLTVKPFSPGIILIIIFAVFTLISVEAAMIFYILAKYYYAYKQDNRQKILAYIAKEGKVSQLNEKKQKFNE